MADLNNDIASLANAFDEFKNTNDARLAQIESKGSADYVTTDKLNKINADLDALQSAITDMGKKSNRIGTGDASAQDEEYKSAFDKWARKGDRYEAELEAKALTTGDSTGGFLVPKTVEAGIREDLRIFSPIRSEATVIQTSNDRYTFLKNNRGLAVGWVGETDARPETATPTLSEVALPGGEIYANPAVSQRALDDSQFNLEAWLQNEIVNEMAIAENKAFVSGDGVNKPKGFLTETGLTTVKTGAAAAMPAGADYLFQMIYAMDSAYRPGSKFYSAGATTASIRTIKDNTGNYIWQPSLVAGKPAQIAGFDHVDLEDMDAIAAGKTPLVFANLKQGYTIADRIGVRTLRDPYTHKPFVHFYATKRVSGMVTDAKAFVLLKVQA
jgi:HK97 family phage major capsid protein